MNKVFSFLAGALCGALIGSTTALLLTPASGEQLKANAINRWQTAVADAKQAMTDKQRELELQFEQATQSGDNNRPGTP
jgi:gas vesicle protein